MTLCQPVDKTSDTLWTYGGRHRVIHRITSASSARGGRAGTTVWTRIDGLRWDGNGLSTIHRPYYPYSLLYIPVVGEG